MLRTSYIWYWSCAILQWSVFCRAWGNLGHRTVALLAAKQFTSTGKIYASNILEGVAIDDAALWPDAFKTTPEGAYTFSWHFVDAEDDPPLRCNVNLQRDCHPERVCIIAAFQNMTAQLLNRTFSPQEHKIAYSFIAHLIGDMHMPLHAEGLAKGGNDIPVSFNGTKSNLHYVWDISIPQKLTRSDESSEKQAAQDWADSLFERQARAMRGNGFDFHQTSLTVSEPIDVLHPVEQALLWASEANSWVCQYILVNGTNSLANKELSGHYYEGAVPIVEELITKSARRLALWTNALAELAQPSAAH